MKWLDDEVCNAIFHFGLKGSINGQPGRSQLPFGLNE